MRNNEEQSPPPEMMAGAPTAPPSVLSAKETLSVIRIPHAAAGQLLHMELRLQVELAGSVWRPATAMGALVANWCAHQFGPDTASVNRAIIRRRRGRRRKVLARTELE
jgi:hypothetical protein